LNYSDKTETTELCILLKRVLFNLDRFSNYIKYSWILVTGTMPCMDRLQKIHDQLWNGTTDHTDHSHDHCFIGTDKIWSL